MSNPSNFIQRLFLGDGSASGPSISFLDDTQSGFFLKSSGVVGLAISGTEVVNWSSSGQGEVGGVFSAANGSAAAPSYTFTSDPDTGLYSGGANILDFSTGGVLAGGIDANGVWSIGGSAQTGLHNLFGSLSISKTSNQFVLGTTNTTTISASAPAASVVYTLPDQGSAANFILSAGTAQSISSALTLSSAVAITPTTNQLVLGTTRTITISASQPATSSRVYTIPDQGAAANFLMDQAAQTVTGQQTFSAAPILSAGLTGVTTNSNAAAGIVGEIISASRLKSAATGATSTTSLNVTSAALSLTAGDWDVSGAIGYLGTGTTSITILKAAISKTTATLPASDTLAVPTSGEVTAQFSQVAGVDGANDITIQLPTTRISLAGTTSIFLVANATFSVSTLTVYGSLNARRVR